MSSRARRFRSASFSLPVILLAVALSGKPPVFAGEPEWVEVHSPNFSVVTDAGERRGREVAMRFEQMRGVFGALMVKEKVNLPIPLQIVAFRNTKEMRQVAPLFNGKPTQVAGLFQGGSDRSFIMLDMSVDNPWTVVFHEYAHQLLNGNLDGTFAPWFEEGFAEYFSSIEVDSKEARVGRIPDYTYRILQQVGSMKVADLLKVQQNTKTYNESGDHRTSFYAESAILMHYIYDNQLMAKVAAYFDLTENKHVRVEEAIQQAFGMSAQQFDKTLYSYFANGQYRYYRIPTPASISSKDYVVTPLSAAGGNAVLADIHLHSRDYQERALAEFQDVLKSDPNNAAACRGLGYAYLLKQDFTQAAEYFKRASQLDSKDPRVHYYNALLMVRENGFESVANLPTMTRELETSISLDPKFADSYALLAFAQSTAGDHGKAIATMRKALAISPRNENYVFNLANLYLANGQTNKAIATLEALQGAGNPELSKRVNAALAQAQQFRRIQTGGNSDPEMIELRQEKGEARPEVIAKTSPLAPVKAQASGGATKYINGMLTAVDCSTPPLATLTVVSEAKTLRMNVADRNHVILIGADAFSCAWSRQKVALNYRETSDSEGNVISLEIQSKSP